MPSYVATDRELIRFLAPPPPPLCLMSVLFVFTCSTSPACLHCSSLCSHLLCPESHFPLHSILQRASVPLKSLNFLLRKSQCFLSH